MVLDARPINDGDIVEVDVGEGQWVRARLVDHAYKIVGPSVAMPLRRARNSLHGAEDEARMMGPVVRLPRGASLRWPPGREPPPVPDLRPEMTDEQRGWTAESWWDAPYARGCTFVVPSARRPAAASEKGRRRRRRSRTKA
jgi:hypothetical protein